MPKIVPVRISETALFPFTEGVFGKFLDVKFYAFEPIEPSRIFNTFFLSIATA
jgi:hypothetical protein